MAKPGRGGKRVSQATPIRPERRERWQIFDDDLNEFIKTSSPGSFAWNPSVYGNIFEDNEVEDLPNSVPKELRISGISYSLESAGYGNVPGTPHSGKWQLTYAPDRYEQRRDGMYYPKVDVVVERSGNGYRFVTSGELSTGWERENWYFSRTAYYGG